MRGTLARAVPAGATRNASLAFRWTASELGFRKHSPIFILGNQKSGTTAIAQLFAKANGLHYSHDIIYRRRLDNALIFRGEQDINAFIRKCPLEFCCDVVKEPDFTFLIESIIGRFPASVAFFIMREPASNIRSQFDRLGISGAYEGANLSAATKLHDSKLWMNVLRLDLRDDNHYHPSFVSGLARRWLRVAKIALRHQRRVNLIRYEDFVRDKIGTIRTMSLITGLEGRNDIRPFLNVHYQPRGLNVGDPRNFFSERNFALIRDTTDRVAKRFYSDAEIELVS